MKFTLRRLLVWAAATAFVLFGWGWMERYYFHRGDGINTAQLEAVLRLADESSPEKDVANRVAQMDFRYVGCCVDPRGPEFPGVSRSRWKAIWKEKDYRLIHGMSDAIESGYHHHLMDRSWVYARGFNQAMAKARRDNIDFSNKASEKEKGGPSSKPEPLRGKPGSRMTESD